MSTLALSSRRAATPVRWLRWLPSPLALVCATLAGLLVAITLAKGLGDPDYYWHVTAGRLIATTGNVPTADPFSFTWEGRPWTPHEWLSELLMYRLVESFGETGALFVFALLPGLAIAAVAWVVRRCTCTSSSGVALPRAAAGSRPRTLAIALPACLAALVLASYATLRPQAISWLFVALLVAALMELRPERRWMLALLPPFFALWANVHGLYVVGLGVVALYTLFTLAGRTPMAPLRGWMLTASVWALLASALTPAGPMGLLYPLRYIDGGDWGLANIQEWQSPDFHDPSHLALLILILAVAANGGRATPGWLAALSYVGVAMSLLALRNAPLAALFALPTLALGVDARLADWQARRARGRNREPAPSVQAGRRVMEIALAACVVVGGIVVTLPRATSGASDFPAEAVSILERDHPDARVLAEYGWGGYVISRLHDDGGRVFVDGRNDMYDQRILEDYSAIRAADSGWEELVEEYRVEAILLPPKTTLTRGPAQQAGWCEAYRDDLQVLLLRICR